jgi:hypothetical protein
VIFLSFLLVLAYGQNPEPAPNRGPQPFIQFQPRAPESNNPNPQPARAPETTNPVPQSQVKVPSTNPVPQPQVKVPSTNPVPQPQVKVPSTNPVPQPQVRVPSTNPVPQPQVKVPSTNPVPQPQVKVPSTNPVPQPQVKVPSTNPVPQPQVKVPSTNPVPQPQVKVPSTNPVPQPQVKVPSTNPVPSPQVKAPESKPSPQPQVKVPESPKSPQPDTIILIPIPQPQSVSDGSSDKSKGEEKKIRDNALQIKEDIDQSLSSEEATTTIPTTILYLDQITVQITVTLGANGTQDTTLTKICDIWRNSLKNTCGRDFNNCTWTPTTKRQATGDVFQGSTVSPAPATTPDGSNGGSLLFSSILSSILFVGIGFLLL